MIIAPFFKHWVLFDYVYIKASIKKGIAFGPSEIGCESERSAIASRAKKGGKSIDDHPTTGR